MVKNPPANAGDEHSAPAWMGKTPWRRKWQSTYSCLENPMDRGAWWATVHRVAKSQTRLKQLEHAFTHIGNVIYNCIYYTHYKSFSELLVHNNPEWWARY